MRRRLFLWPLLLVVSNACGQQDIESRSRIVLLGTGTPNANPQRSGPAVAVLVGDTPYLVDCGPGVVRRAAAAFGDMSPPLDVTKLNHLFVTHLHSDHTTGLADFIFTPWVLGRSQAIQAYGPPGLKHMVDHLHAAYVEDIEMRVKGLEQANSVGYRVDVHEIHGGEIYKNHRVTVHAAKVHHGSWKHALAYKFHTPDGVIVISGDTGPSPSLLEFAKGCDVLVHEVYSAKQFANRPPKWKRYHASFHTSTTQLAAIAREIKPKILVLYHQLFWGASNESLLAEVQAGYDGRVISANDLDVIPLP